ncbi:MAG: hypothetical protein KatS3mg102_0095 [Planctomycetota bacterium]|nr:MAG: hypothetical protein KatS3mg102_0095 [Planctomycetota bacterium]
MDEEILQVFERFARAVRDGDAPAFAALCVEDAPPEQELFARNSAKVQRHGWTLRPRRIDHTGQIAELTFEVVDPGGRVVDQGVLTLSHEPGGWRIRAL